MTKLFGKYQVVRRLAVGGMAEVFLAAYTGPGGFVKPVAIKRVLPHLTDDEEFVRMFFDEARILARFSHPNIVQILDLGKVGASYLLVMEYIHGVTMEKILKVCASQKRCLPLEYGVKIVSYACEALEYAHNFTQPDGTPLNLVHRDISPGNIMVSYEGVVKILDFGVAKAAGNLTMTQPSFLKGKAGYMSPEQISQTPGLDRRSDVFSLGVVLFELATGQRPFVGDTEFDLMMSIVKDQPLGAREINPNTPAELAQIIRRALAKDREARYQSAREMRADLETFLFSRRMLIDQVTIANFIKDLASQHRAEGTAKSPVARTPLSDSLIAADATPVRNTGCLKAEMLRRASGGAFAEPLPKLEAALARNETPDVKAAAAQEPLAAPEALPDAPAVREQCPAAEAAFPLGRETGGAVAPQAEELAPSPPFGELQPQVFGLGSLPGDEKRAPTARPRWMLAGAIAALSIVGGVAAALVLFSAPGDGRIERTQTGAGSPAPASSQLTRLEPEYPLPEPEPAPSATLEAPDPEASRQEFLPKAAPATIRDAGVPAALFANETPALLSNDPKKGEKPGKGREGSAAMTGRELAKPPAAVIDPEEMVVVVTSDEGTAPEELDVLVSFAKETPGSSTFPAAPAPKDPGGPVPDPPENAGTLVTALAQDPKAKEPVVSISEPIYQAPDAVKKRRIAGEDPRFPAIAREARREGAVVAKISIDTEGQVQEVKFLKADAVFENAVLEAVRGWKFSPLQINGRPVATYSVFKFRFSLD